MITEKLIEKDFDSLSSEMTVGEALGVFEKSRMPALPVLNHGHFEGMIFRSALAGLKDAYLKLAELKEHFVDTSILPETRMVTALKKMVNEGIANIPIIKHSGEMVGMLSAMRLWNEFALRSSLLGHGSWIIISTDKKDYSLSKLSHLIESHGLMIVMHFVQFFQGLDVIDIHLKVNRENVNELAQTLQRYGYRVTGVIQPRKYVDDWEDKFEELMRFFST